MSKHKMVDGRLLQMDKSFGQLKQKQKEKISEWMYQAYRKQTSGKLSDEEALQLVFDRIEEAKIWIPDYEILNPSTYLCDGKHPGKSNAEDGCPGEED